MAYIWKSHSNIVWSVHSSHLYMGSWYRIQLARLYLPTEPSHQPKFSFRVSLVLLSVHGKHLTFALQSHIIHQHQLLVTEKGFTDSLGLSTSITLTSMSKNKFISYLASYIHLFSRPYFYLHVCTCVCWCAHMDVGACGDQKKTWDLWELLIVNHSVWVLGTGLWSSAMTVNHRVISRVLLFHIFTAESRTLGNVLNGSGEKRSS